LAAKSEVPQQRAAIKPKVMDKFTKGHLITLFVGRI